MQDMLYVLLRSLCLRILLILILRVTILKSYLIVVDESAAAATVIFNSSVYKLGSERNYKINLIKTASFVDNLIRVDHKTGQVLLKRTLRCDGVQYPNWFTIYVDSTTTHLRSVNYYSLPIRIYITGKNCNDNLHKEYVHREHAFTLRENNLQFTLNNTQKSFNKDISTPSRKYYSFSNFGNRRAFERVERHSNFNAKNSRIFRTIYVAKQWISETFASYAIHTADKWNKVCLKQSQLINNLSSFLPRTITHYCQVKFLETSDFRVKIEPKNQDLVASENVCINEALWKVIVSFSIQCSLKNVLDSNHRLKIIYHHQEFNDTDIARRVRRELRNQSPYFEEASYVASVLEEQQTGIVVTTVRARDPEDSPVVYSMTSLLDSRSQLFFKIDSHTGVVSTSAGLDRESMDMHYFRIVATDDSFPPRSGTTTLQVNVLDCNDNSPVFESEHFDATIREGSPMGSTVITVHATDQDSGKNAEIEYMIESIRGGGLTSDRTDSETFQIDSKTGVMTTKSGLDREETEIYTVIVVAADSPPVHTERNSATTTIVITVSDDNDNYPQFNERSYSVLVKENVWDNKVITQIKAIDADKGNNAAIRYAIIGGNTQSQFSIDSMTGEVSLVKPLDYENVHNYRLVIRAQDGGSPSKSNTTQLLINVIDVNDNPPRFYVSQYQETVLESISVGYNILRVQAYDADEGVNAEIQYSIIEQKDNFPILVDQKTGWIQTAKQLDREECPRYNFQVLAIDGGIPHQSASASVIITVQDINDNDPVFQPKYYEVSISEDLPPGSSVISVTATDPDEDTRLHYDITAGNIRGRFAINVQNGKGVITIAQPLDYKQERRFLLIVTASDSGGRLDTVNVNISITDANNFAPVFDNSPYSASVFEDAPIGTTVLIVSATDNDVGVNAQITYSLQDESTNGMFNSNSFTINAKTGAITTTGSLDREQTSAYLLTVKASDGGQPSFSDTTDVEITVIDVNDNPPTFQVSLYQASISEDAIIGTSVVQICAHDFDAGQNGRIKYSLSQNDENEGSFIIDSNSGTIRTNKALDRENVAVYQLIAIATDKGLSSLSGSVEVHVKLEDVNDSPPTFTTDKIVMYIKENSPIGSVVGNIEAHDPDEGVNAIIQYSIISGDDLHSFSLLSRPGTEGAQLLTLTELDYESSKKQFDIIVRAASPPLRSDVHIEIMVTDVNDNAPILKDFHVIFNNFQDSFPINEIGRVPALDADVTDQLNFKILSGNNADLVRLNSSTGGITLSPQLNTNVPRQAIMEISVSDGINEVRATMQLVVRLITEEMLFNSVTVRLNDMTEEAFLSSLFNFFVEGLSAIIPCPKENIYLFSIQEDHHETAKILNISFAATRPDFINEQYYSTKYLQQRVYLNRDILASLSTIDVLPFDDDLCVREPCLNFEQCSTILKFGNASLFMHSDTILFRPIYPVNTFVCHCPDGYTGSKEHYLCDTEVDLCYSNPCQNNGTCVRREGGYSCICKYGFIGVACEIPPARELKPCEKGLCQHNHSCLPNNILENESSYYTSTCGLKSRSFNLYTYAIFKSLSSRYRFNIKLKFSTIEENGLIFYNGRYNELHDFIALEIIDGQLSFSFSLGGTKKTVSIRHSKSISDGLWHSVEVIYFNRTATLILDECDKVLGLKGNIGYKWNCANKTSLVLQKKCSSSTVPCYRFLDLTGPFQLGGLRRLRGDFPVKVYDFVGCISDLYIDHRFIDMNSFIFANETIPGCPQKRPFCLSEPCFNGGTCREGWNGHICDCPERYTGNACQEIVSAPWRFSQNSVLSFNPLLRPIQYPWYIGLSIRTWQKHAFLMQIQVGQNSSVVIMLQNGFLHFAYETDSFKLQTINLADGKWRRIDIIWKNSAIKVSIDYDQRIVRFPFVKKVQGQYVGKIVHGIVDKNFVDMVDTTGYEGCIRDVRIGGVQSVLNWPSTRDNVEDGCQSKARCPKKCTTNSMCVEEWDNAYCECVPGYIGDDCVHSCSLNPCVSGVCHQDSIDLKFYHCECNATVNFGEYCENTVEYPCPVGWWGEKGCGPCKCSERDGYNADCNKTTGQCHCKPSHYRPMEELSCLACNCYHLGSIGNDCNTTTGQCACRDGVIGHRCDSCSNPYAEVTLAGCEVVYDVCPRSLSEGVWWNRTPLGQTAIQNCPGSARGKGSRICDNKTGRWQHPDMFNCTSQPFFDLRKQLSQLDNSNLKLNTFLAIKIARDLKLACQLFVDDKSSTQRNNRWVTMNSSIYSTKKDVWDINYEMNYLSDETKFSHDHFYGTDIFITEQLLHEIIKFEIMQNGLNLSHSQDKGFVNNLVFSASKILSEKYDLEWHRMRRMLQRGPQDLIDAFRNYITVLTQSQCDTYSKPFEVVQNNMALGLDTVTLDSVFGYKAGDEYEPMKTDKSNLKEIVTENVKIENTSPFLQNFASGKLGIWIPKYDNYIQDKTKFDKQTKALLPLGLLGIDISRDNNYKSDIFNCHPVVSYVQYKDAGVLFPEVYDDTISRRWGVKVRIASSIFSLVIYAPNSEKLNLMSKIDSNTQTYNKYDLEKNVKTTEEPQEKIEIMPHALVLDDLHLSNIRDWNNVNLNGKNQSNNLGRRFNKRQANGSKDNGISSTSLESQLLQFPIRLQMLVDIHRVKFGPRFNPQCVRWNRLTNSWTRLGCQTEIPYYETLYFDRDILINCTCTQLSSYAILMDVVSFEDIPEPSITVQIVLFSTFLLALAMLALVLIALTILRGSQTNSNHIHQNMVFCIFCAELLFFVGMQTRNDIVDKELLCKLLAILLHYSWLAAFIWITIDCIHLYRMLTEMRDINHGSMGFYFSLGYGAPAIIVGLAVGVRTHEYGNNLFCWLSVYEPVVWWLVGPVSGLSATSLFILFLCVKSAFSLKDHILGFGNLRTLLLLSMISLPLMGMTWVLTMLSASDNSQVLIVLLCIAVLIHALFCLIGYCVVNQRVRDNLRITLFQCMGKKVPLVNSSVVNDRPPNIKSVTNINSYLGEVYACSKRNIGISTSSTTSRSTAKTNSSPYSWNSDTDTIEEFSAITDLP